MITLDDFEVFCRRSLGGALRTVDSLGDDLVNVRPVTTEGNSAFALVTHLLGAAHWWIGHIILGEPSDRRRDDEFVATGSVEDLHRSVDAWLEFFSSRRAAVADRSTVAIEPATQTPLDGEWTVGAALLHIYEEIAQHLGHLEVTADIVRAEAQRT